MKKKEPIFEIIIDGEVTEEISGFEKLDEIEDKFIELFKENGYEELMFSNGGSSGYRVFFNENTLKSTSFGWRELTGFVDKNGDRIYCGDMIHNTESDVNCTLDEYSELSNKKGFYIRNLNSWTEIPITANEIKKEYTVIHCVFPEVVNKNIKKKK